jgi:hypothetical protein
MPKLCQLCGSRFFDLGSASPEVDGHENREDEEAAAKFIGDVVRSLIVHRERIEEGLDKGIVGGVQDHAGPDAAGLETHPRPDEGQEWKHDGQQRHIKPDGSIALVIGEENDGIVPEGPDESGESSRGGKAVCFSELGDKESAPANLFADDGCGIPDDTEGRREDEVERDAGPCGKRAEAKGERDLVEEVLVVKGAEAGEPDESVDDGGVGERDEVGDDFVTACAPTPAECIQVAAEQSAGDQCGHAGRPHEAGDVGSPAAAHVTGTDDQEVEDRAEQQGEQKKRGDRAISHSSSLVRRFIL